MHSPFDWLRLAFTGPELLATWEIIAHEPEILSSGAELGVPLSALDGPCARCWQRRRLVNDEYCLGCQTILKRRKRYTAVARQVVLIWGYVNQLPRYLRQSKLTPGTAVLSLRGNEGSYVHDDHHFLHVLYRSELQSWLQDLLLYDGGTITGLLQIFPTYGVSRNLCMNDLLCRIIYRDKVTGHNEFNIRFYAQPHHIFHHYALEDEGLLSFDAAQFLGMLEMASVFRNMLRRQEQDVLRELLTGHDVNQTQFYWGRFLGMLSPESRDMLHAWQVRQWSPQQINLFYELLQYVHFDLQQLLERQQT